MRNLIWLAVLAACSSKSGNNNIDAPAGGSDSGSHDSGPTVDAQPAPATITISGTASSQSITGSAAVSGAVVAAYAASAPTTVIMMTTTGTDGSYSMTVPTGGVALNGFLKATAATYVDTYLWPPAPLTASFSDASINFLTADTEALATGTLCGVSGGQGSSDALIGLEVTNSSGSDITGATVTASPAAAKYCYDEEEDGMSLPAKAATSTDADGVALLINVPAGEVTLSGSATGNTFASHTINAVAGAFTTTVVEAE